MDEGESAAMPDPAVNVAGVYAALRDDIAPGGQGAPGFGHALCLARLVESVLASGADGARKPAADWPLT